jgi:ABC-type transport system involved in multi-copper enzyme maturation permease subunit
VNGTLAVARYTLLELSRRRLLLVFFIVGALGLAALALLLFIASNLAGASVVTVGPGGVQPDPAKLKQVTEFQFVNLLLGVLGLFTLIISIAIGMTTIYHDLDSGAAVSIFSKPVSRAAYTIGKMCAAIGGMILVVGLLSIEARFLMLLFGGGLEQALWVETVASVANGLAMMLLVLALSTWMNNIVAVVIALIYRGVEQFIVSLHQAVVAGFLGTNQLVNNAVNVAYWLVPHPLTSDAAREIARAELTLFAPPPGEQGPNIDQSIASIPGASGTPDILWWVFVVCVFALLVYVAVRRRQV